VYVIWHYYGCMKVVAFAVVVQAVMEDGVSGFWDEGNSISSAEGDEYCSSCFLIVREHAAVFVFSVERGLGHEMVHIKNKRAKTKVKGVGQECPTHTSIAFPYGFCL
jgi:hypothetical protein